MNRPAFVAATCVWWFLVVLPGVLSIAGAFGTFNANTTIGGAVVGAWLVCFIGQLAMVFVMQHAAGHSHASWFFVASLLPWIADWGMPFGTLVFVVILVVTIVAAGLIVFFALRVDHLDAHGAQVDATVVKVMRNLMNVVVNGVYLRRRVLVTYSLPDGTPQRRVIPMLTEIGDSPSIGSHLTLRVDPHHPRHVVIDPASMGAS